MLKESNFHRAHDLLHIRRKLQYIAARDKRDTQDWLLRFYKTNGDVMTNLEDRGAVDVALAALRAHLHTVENELRELGVELDCEEAETV